MINIYPKSSIPLTPILGIKASSNVEYPNIPSVLDIKHLCMTTSGRYALALALEHIGIHNEDIVMLPAYHCEAMVAPFKRLGIKPIFYSINPDTSINLGDIEQKISDQVKVIIVIHYFGFLQDLSGIRVLCDRYDVKLIEDCAHAFWGINKDLQPIGSIGDYAIASSMKFLPIYEGGLLCSATLNFVDVKVAAPNVFIQIKSFLNIIEKTLEYNRLGILGKILKSLLNLKDFLWTTLKPSRLSSSVSSTNKTEVSDAGYYGLDERFIHNTVSITSKFIIKLTNLNQIAFQQRKNYQRLHSALSTLPGCRPLFDNLPQMVVPWVYPLYIHNPDKFFSKLKMLGVPIWRFGEFLDAEVTEKICPVSIEYSHHIFQFPCHPYFTNEELDWMIKQITQILTEAE